MPKQRQVAADGWIHEEPLPPHYEAAKTLGPVVVVVAAAFLAAYGAWPISLVLVAGYGAMRLMGVWVFWGANRQHNYCPECNRQTRYDPYQKKCICGYAPSGVTSLIVAVCGLGFLFGSVFFPPGVHAQDIKLPVGREEATVETVPQPVRPSEVYPELFGKDAVAPDVTPEFRALVNDPSWDKAVLAYQKQVLGIVHVLEGIRLYEAVKRYYEEEIARETGITMVESPGRYYQELLKRFGYADIRTPIPKHLEKYDLFSLSASNIAKLLRQKLSQIPLTPAVTP